MAFLTVSKISRGERVHVRTRIEKQSRQHDDNNYGEHDQRDGLTLYIFMFFFHVSLSQVILNFIIISSYSSIFLKCMLGLKEDSIDTAQDQHTDVAKEEIAKICSRLSLHSYIHIFIYFYLSHSPLLVFFFIPCKLV